MWDPSGCRPTTSGPPLRRSCSWCLAELTIGWSAGSARNQTARLVHAHRMPCDTQNGPSGRLCLLRPDGYVAAGGSVARPDTVLDCLHRLFGTAGARQPAPASVPPRDALCGELSRGQSWASCAVPAESSRPLDRSPRRLVGRTERPDPDGRCRDWHRADVHAERVRLMTLLAVGSSGAPGGP